MTFHYDTDPLRPQVEAIMKASKETHLSPEEAYFYQLRCEKVTNALFGAARWNASIMNDQPHVEGIIRELWATNKHFTEVSKPLVLKGRTAFLDTIDFHVRQLGMMSIEVGQYGVKSETIPGVAYHLMVFTKGVCEDEEAIEVEATPYRKPPSETWMPNDPVYLNPINGQSPEEAHSGTSIQYLFDANGRFLRIHVCA